MSKPPPRRGAGRMPEGDGANPYMPSADDVLAYIRDNPDRASKREIAKAFGIKGSDRIALKSLLAGLAEDGAVTPRGKRLTKAGSLPHVGVLEVTGRDGDGGLMARPVEWDETAHGKPPTVEIALGRRDSGPAPGVGDRVLAKLFRNDRGDGPDYVGRVMKRLERQRPNAIGVVRRTDKGAWRIEPVDRKQPEYEVDADSLNGAEPGDLVEVSVLRRPRYGLTNARVESVVGSLASEKAVSMIAIHTHEIPHVFPQEVLAEASAAPRATMDDREDWRALPLITIDPVDAKDHDDAVHAEPDSDPTNPGGHVVTVAIADVALYVRPGSALDREALKRGNSVYFPDRVVPMLPERISNDLCSLREGEDRPALAVRMTVDAEGRKRSHSFHRIMMKSAAKLAYEQAQAAIDGAPDEKTGPLLDPVLRPLWAAWRATLRARAEREPLDLDLPERKIMLGADGRVERVVIPPRLEAHRLIEEFMIAANVAAAETLEQARQPLVYRVHDAPPMAKQEGLREFLKTIGLSLARGAAMRPASFNGILAKVMGTDEEALVNEVVLRSQAQAEYSPDNYGHFGLNLRRYAHFTSPIRRYADLTVHRALIGALKFGAGGVTGSDIERLREVSGMISATERRAQNAERDTVDRLIALHLAEAVGKQFVARVTGMAPAGLFVTLADLGADGFIPASTLGREYYRYDEAARTFSGDRTGKGWQLGDTVEVRLVEAQPYAGSLRFEMLTEARALARQALSHHKATKGRRNLKPGRARYPDRRR